MAYPLAGLRLSLFLTSSGISVVAANLFEDAIGPHTWRPMAKDAFPVISHIQSVWFSFGGSTAGGDRSETVAVDNLHRSWYAVNGRLLELLEQ